MSFCQWSGVSGCRVESVGLVAVVANFWWAARSLRLRESVGGLYTTVLHNRIICEQMNHNGLAQVAAVVGVGDILGIFGTREVFV